MPDPIAKLQPALSERYSRWRRKRPDSRVELLASTVIGGVLASQDAGLTARGGDEFAHLTLPNINRAKSAAMAFIAVIASACGTTEPTVARVDVSPPAATLTALGDSLQLTATVQDGSGHPLNGTAISWSSASPEVATVSLNGIVAAISNGTTTVTATVDGIIGRATITVAQAAARIVVIPPLSFSALRDSARPEAVATDSRGSVITGKRFTWQSSDTAVATVDSSGLVTALGNGDAAVTAAADGITQGDSVHVHQVVAAVDVVPQHLALSPGDSIQLTAVPRDHNAFPVTDAVVAWSSADPSVALVRSSGIVRAAAQRLGSVDVTASSGGETGTSVIDVVVTFTSIAAGSRHTCAATNAGTTYCWGFNGDGELGDGGTADEQRPRLVAGAPTFTLLAAGAFHTCALTATLSAYCWGRGGGALGDGTGTGSLTPVPVAGGHQFEAIAAGGHTCAITMAATAFCWGDNTSGQLGDSTFVTRLTPAAVAGGVSFTAIGTRSNSAGIDVTHTCALATSGDAYCWGSNADGALGEQFPPLGATCTGSIGSLPCSSVPVLVSGSMTFTAIASGGFHSCALAQGGAAFCWGSNGLGQLGTDGPSSSAPVAVAGSLVLAQLAAGDSHTCGLTVSGAAYCWGANSQGQLGDGSLVNRFAPVAVSGGIAFTFLSVGGSHTCGITAGGAAYCWGWNSAGQLGAPVGSQSSVPVPVSGSRP